MTDKITLDVNGSIATITNRNVEKHNAFDDEMDAELLSLIHISSPRDVGISRMPSSA